MKKHDLLRSGDSIIRVLEVQECRVLIIDCIKRTMPVWVEPSVLSSYYSCDSVVLNEATGYNPISADGLDAEQWSVCGMINCPPPLSST